MLIESCEINRIGFSFQYSKFHQSISQETLGKTEPYFRKKIYDKGEAL